MNERTEELPVEGWAEYFEQLSREIDGQLVTIEVMSEQLGDQTDVARLPLQAIEYDARERLLEISVGGRGVRYPIVLRHFIAAPQSIAVEQAGGLIPSAMLVVDGEGQRTLIRVHEPAALES